MFLLVALVDLRDFFFQIQGWGVGGGGEKGLKMTRLTGLFRSFFFVIFRALFFFFFFF